MSKTETRKRNTRVQVRLDNKEHQAFLKAVKRSRLSQEVYLRHLINVNEMYGAMLLSLHNITFLHKLMKGLRDSILGGYVKDYTREFYRKYGGEGKW